MKMALEELPVSAVAQEGGAHAAAIEAALIRALDDGVVTGPEPLIKRQYNPEHYQDIDRSFLAARIFTLQGILRRPVICIAATAMTVTSIGPCRCSRRLVFLMIWLISVLPIMFMAR
jgi:hypothetical protein